MSSDYYKPPTVGEITRRIKAEDRRFERNLLIGFALFLALVLGGAAALFIHTQHADQACHDRGGVMVGGAGRSACIDRDSVIQPRP